MEKSVLSIEWIGATNWELLPLLRPLVEKFKAKAKSELDVDVILTGMLRCLVDETFRVLVARNGDGPVGYSVVQMSANPPWHPPTLYILQGYSAPGYREATEKGMKKIEAWAREWKVKRIVAETKRFSSLVGMNKLLKLAPMTATIVKEL